MKDFTTKLKSYEIDLTENIKNTVKSGWCGTVPEVIKSSDKKEQLSKNRKLRMVDMEAYYLALWHNYISESENLPQSKMLVFKCASDYGDENKEKFEDSGSRILAMRNLCFVVSNYCTRVHTFSFNSNMSLLSYFKNQIGAVSTDKRAIANPTSINTTTQMLENIFEHFIESENQSFDKTKSIQSAFSLMKNDECAILLRGRSGTGKSTFMSFLYNMVSASDSETILIDFSKFSSSSKPTVHQIVYMLDKLMSLETKLNVFLDGIDSHADYYKNLLDVLDKDEYARIGYCLADDNLNDDSETLIPQRFNVVTLEFRGVSVYSPEYDDTLLKAEEYFTNLGESFSKDIVKNFADISEITNIDFRFLSMVANYFNVFKHSRSLYAFINRHIIYKFGRTTVDEYKNTKHVFSSKIAQHIPIDYRKIHNNSYANSLIVAQVIVESFENDWQDHINMILNNEFVLSNDMNLFLNNRIKSTSQLGNIITKIKEVLVDNDIKRNICVETQLLYSVCSVISNNHSEFSFFKKLVEQKAIDAEFHSKNSLDTDCNLWRLQYRTLCIILNEEFNNSVYLHEYNNLLLDDLFTATQNLSFHFLYYSKRSFTFKDVNLLNHDTLCKEAILNTYYLLQHSLQNIIANIMSNDPFVFLNLITYLQLITTMLIENKRLIQHNDEIRKFIKELRRVIKGLVERNIQKPTYIDKIQDLLTEVSEKLDRISLSKRL